MAVGVLIPIAGNCCVGQTRIVGSTGATVMVCATTSSAARAKARLRTAQTRARLAFLFIADPPLEPFRLLFFVTHPPVRNPLSELVTAIAPRSWTFVRGRT